MGETAAVYYEAAAGITILVLLANYLAWGHALAFGGLFCRMTRPSNYDTCSATEYFPTLSQPFHKGHPFKGKPLVFMVESLFASTFGNWIAPRTYTGKCAKLELSMPKR